jgi:hypothetical protein
MNMDLSNGPGSDGRAQLLVHRYATAVTWELPGADVLETDDVVRIAWGDMEGIVALVTREALELRLPTIEWPHPHEPRQSSRLWRRVEWSAIDDRPVLRSLLDEALAARRAEFRQCRYCGGVFPPEHMFKEDVCHGCASNHLGIIF